jgi:hypothetical protein
VAGLAIVAGERPRCSHQRLSNTLPALISDTTRATVNQIDRLIEAMMAIVSNNRALLSPIGDWQAIDTGLAFTLLALLRVARELMP